jgi:hypothetical protein
MKRNISVDNLIAHSEWRLSSGAIAHSERRLSSRAIAHSERRLFIRFAGAVFIAWKLTVISAIIMDNARAPANIF